MKYKSDKYPDQPDDNVSRYTRRRIRELRGLPVTYYDQEDSRGMHPYIRRRLDELKREGEKENS